MELADHISPALLADVILLLHVLFVLVVVGSTLLIAIGGWKGWEWVRSPGLRILHLLMIVFVAMESLFGVVCPLTRWENDYRLMAGQQPYGDNGMIAEWLGALLFHSFPSWVFTCLYVGFALCVASLFYFVPLVWRGRGIPAPRPKG